MSSIVAYLLRSEGLPYVDGFCVWHRIMKLTVSSVKQWYALYEWETLSKAYILIHYLRDDTVVK